MAEHELVNELRQLEDAMCAVLEDLVMTETPSSDTTLLSRGSLVASTLIHRLLGDVPEAVDVDGRRHLRLCGGGKNPVLVLCHLDTVWPAGTVNRWPFSARGGRATGPGVFDMKGGLVQALYALSLLPDHRDITLLVTTDEEIGSPTSRALIEDESRKSRAVLVAEPSAAGALKVARKGVSMYRLSVSGRASHAGLEPEHGVNALLELAHQILAIASSADPEVGTTVTPTTARAGTSSNTVPAHAEVQVDVRAWTAAEQQRVHLSLSGLAPRVPRTRIEVSGGVNRPPLEVGASAMLAALAQQCADELGLPAMEQAAVGGASDGNFTGALGTPTLDGLGAVGGNAHAEGEWIDTACMPQRAALLCRLLQRLISGDPDAKGATDRNALNTTTRNA